MVLTLAGGFFVMWCVSVMFVLTTFISQDVNEIACVWNFNRIAMDLSCTMYLARFPFDEQECSIKISTCKSMTMYFAESLLTQNSELKAERDICNLYVSQVVRLSRSCIVLKWQKISTRFLWYTTASCLSHIVLECGLHRFTLPRKTVSHVEF